MVQFEWSGDTGGRRGVRQPLPGEPVISIDFGDTRTAQSCLEAVKHVVQNPPSRFDPPIGIMSSKWMLRDMRRLEREISFSLSSPRIRIPGGVACGLLISLVSVGSRKNVLGADMSNEQIRHMKEIASGLVDSLDVYHPLIKNIEQQLGDL